MSDSLFKKVLEIPEEYREEKQLSAYYAIPVLLGFVVTYAAIQGWVRYYPLLHLSAGGYHIHHYTYGIALLLISGYVGLWTRRLHVKYVCALIHGVAAAFIVDEALLWFSLNPSINYQQDNLAVIIGALLIGIILAPLFFNGGRHHYRRK